MTGLCGIISDRAPDTCTRLLDRMVSAIQDEPFYHFGKHSVEGMGLHVGWTSHPGSFSDCLPILNETKDIALFLAGEIVPESEDLAGLQRSGHSVTGQDASYLVHLYEERGPDFVNGLNGWFHGVLTDKKRGKCYLFNDRYGMRRLFFHCDNGQVFFASQAKALLAVLPETREFDSMSLAEYLTCGCTLGTRSLFKNIDVLDPGSLWTFGIHGLEKRRLYFDRSVWERQERLDERLYAARMRELLPAVVREYGRSRMSLGISLTGGVDTRMVLACLDMTQGNYPCYTFGSMYRETFDVTIARKLADRSGQSHTSIVLGRDFLRDFPAHLERASLQSDGCLSLAGAASLFVNRKARDIAPVRLTGNFGSELLRGVRTFKTQMPRARFYDAEIGPLLAPAQRTFHCLANNDPISFSLFHQAPCLGYGLLSVEESQLVMRTPFMDNRLVMLAYQGPRSYAAGLDLSISIIRQNKPELLDIATDFGYLGRGGRLIKTMRKAYHQALFKGEYLSSHGMPRSIALLIRGAPGLSPERLLLGRHKYQHFRTWLMKDLSEDIRGVLLNGGSFPSCLDKQNVEEILSAHLSGRDNYLDEIEKAITIVLGHRLLLHPEAGPQGSGIC